MTSLNQLKRFISAQHSLVGVGLMNIRDLITATREWVTIFKRYENNLITTL